jgi:hypothetical protein
MNWRVSILLMAALGLGAGRASAQMALPGAAPAAPTGSAAAPAKSAKPRKASSGATKAGKTEGKAAKLVPPGVASIAGQPLRLNGEQGLMQISGDGAMLQIDKLRLSGEGVSDPSQRCVVDIVGEKPIQATSVGRPDGLDRYEVEVPACPFAFDVLSGAVLVPSQITACVFKAADCQTSPGGLWGPDAATIEKDAATIVKRRSLAEKALGKAVQRLEERAKDDPAAADFARGQNSFAGERDDSCRAYAKESAVGYCAATLTEARAALIEARLEGFAAASKSAKSAKDEKPKTAKKKKPKPKPEAAPQTAPQPAPQ